MLFVSILPQKALVERLVGDRMTVTALLPPGADPHLFEPKPRQMADLAGARGYVAVGLPFEEVLLPRLRGVAPGLAVIPGDAGIDKIALASPEALWEHHAPESVSEDRGHPHGAGVSEDAEHHHHHGGLDPHIWTSPRRMAQMARTVTEALEILDPAGGETYRRNLEALEKDVEALDQELRGLLADRRGMAFLVFHPAWGYLAADYGLRQIPLEIEGKEPKAADLARLIVFAREKGVKVLFVAPQFSRKSAAMVAGEIGATLADIDPLAEDWMDNLRGVGTLFHDALR